MIANTGTSALEFPVPHVLGNSVGCDWLRFLQPTPKPATTPDQVVSVVVGATKLLGVIAASLVLPLFRSDGVFAFNVSMAADVLEHVRLQCGFILT